MAANVRFLNPNTLAPQSGYSYVVDTTGPGRTVYIAGQLGLDMENKLVGAPGDFRAQCTKAIENLKAALASVGADQPFSVANVLTWHRVALQTEAGLRQGEREREGGPPPAPAALVAGRLAIAENWLGSDSGLELKAPRPSSTAVGISQLARPGALFEIEAIAVLPAKPATKAAKARAPARSTKAKAGRRKRK